MDDLDPPLRFGTAGLRGLRGPGDRRINADTVGRAVEATLDAWSHAEAPSPPSDVRVVVGHDARPQARALADLAVRWVEAKGWKPVRHPGPCPTPWVSFAIRHVDAVGGFMLTASHNPAEYGGLKVFARQGAQIVPPFDREVEARMKVAGPGDSPPAGSLQGESDHDAEAERIERAYQKSVRDFARGLRRTDRKPGTLSVGYTALHGVGARPFRALVQAEGHTLVEVPEETTPDGRFPGLSNPNPEHPDALKRLRRRVAESGLSLGLAHDPDADRLAVVAPRAPGRVVALSGDAVGGLLAHGILQAWTGPQRPVLVTTQVSSRFVDVLAAAFGARVIRTATGFKWMARAVQNLASTERAALVYEEAMGYAVDSITLDKDGLSAGLCFLEIMANQGDRPDPWARWSALQERFGGFATGQVSLPRTPELMERLAREGAALGPEFPTEAPAEMWDGDGKPASDSVVPALWRQLLAGESWWAVRPSGTEPKMKVYMEATVPPGPNALEAAEARLERLRQQIQGALGGV